MLPSAEEYLVAAQQIRINAASRTGAERELSIKKSNSCVVCVRRMAQDRGGVSLKGFEWRSLTPDWRRIQEKVACLKPGGVGDVEILLCDSCIQFDRQFIVP